MFAYSFRRVSCSLHRLCCFYCDVILVSIIFRHRDVLLSLKSRANSFAQRIRAVSLTGVCASDPLLFHNSTAAEVIYPELCFLVDLLTCGVQLGGFTHADDIAIRLRAIRRGKCWRRCSRIAMLCMISWRFLPELYFFISFHFVDVSLNGSVRVDWLFSVKGIFTP